MKTLLAIALTLVGAAACSKSKSEPTTTTHQPAAKADDHGITMPEVAKFHDGLSPRWHADKGEARMRDTCGAIADFQTNATAIANATPPAGTDPAAWTTSTRSLNDAVVALDASCKTTDAAAFETAFQQVHESFHAVMAFAGGSTKHREHADHGEHKM